jgi:transglutaminase-like putative cysteine protease
MPARGPRTVAAELALLGVSLVVAAGAARLFLGWSWLAPVLLTTVAVHVLGAMARRAGLGVWLQVASVAVVTFLLMCWTQTGDTLRWFLPTGDTLRLFGGALDEALTLYPEARAPTEPVLGFVLATMIGVAIVATMADIAAFRLGSELQALIPPLTLFVFCSLLGSGEHRLPAALAFLATSLVFVLLMRSTAGRSATSWLPGDERRGPRALVRVGSSLTAVAALGAAVVGPALPGADDEGLWTWRGGAGPTTRVVVNPFVDIRARLVEQSGDVVFEVESPEPSYWRMMSLDHFEGDQFRLGSTFRDTGGRLTLPGTERGNTVLTQRVRLEALASPYLPAAFEPVRIETGGEVVTWDDRSATLLFHEDVVPRGFEYTVESVVPDYDPARLRAAPDMVVPSIAERFLQLPDDFDPRITELAESIVGSGATPYDRALLLQNWFRTEFTYSLEVPGGHSESALARFLFVDRIGYCEQFSAAFAAMARSVGLPARVAVGFTVGEQQRGSPTRFVVRGEHAHAWPEVWLQGIGWVPFEPTPGRGDPQAAEHTGVEPDQVGGVVDPDEPATTTTVAPGDRPGTTLDPNLIPDFDLFPTEGGSSIGVRDDGGVPALVRGVGIAAAVAVGWAALLAAAALGVRTWRRRRVAADPARRMALAWDELVAAAASLNIVPDPAETHREYARRLAQAARVDDLEPLAAAAAAARFGGPPPSDERLAELLARVDAVVDDLLARRSRRTRLLDLVDPRRLAGPPRPRAARRQARVSAVLRATEPGG